MKSIPVRVTYGLNYGNFLDYEDDIDVSDELYESLSEMFPDEKEDINLESVLSSKELAPELEKELSRILAEIRQNCIDIDIEDNDEYLEVEVEGYEPDCEDEDYDEDTDTTLLQLKIDAYYDDLSVEVLFDAPLQQKEGD